MYQVFYITNLLQFFIFLSRYTLLFSFFNYNFVFIFINHNQKKFEFQPDSAPELQTLITYYLKTKLTFAQFLLEFWIFKSSKIYYVPSK